MLTIPNQLQQEIGRHGVAAYPNEGCGLLLGYQDGARKVVEAIRPMRNVWPVEAEKPVRFKIDEADWVAAELDAMQRGLDIIGVFHSHPDHPAVASPRDLAWASWPGYSYLITEIRDGTARANRSWQLKDDRSGFVEEDVVVVVAER